MQIFECIVLVCAIAIPFFCVLLKSGSLLVLPLSALWSGSCLRCYGSRKIVSDGHVYSKISCGDKLMNENCECKLSQSECWNTTGKHNPFHDDKQYAILSTMEVNPCQLRTKIPSPRVVCGVQSSSDCSTELKQGSFLRMCAYGKSWLASNVSLRTIQASKPEDASVTTPKCDNAFGMAVWCRIYSTDRSCQQSSQDAQCMQDVNKAAFFTVLAIRDCLLLVKKWIVAPICYQPCNIQVEEGGFCKDCWFHCTADYVIVPARSLSVHSVADCLIVDAYKSTSRTFCWEHVMNSPFWLASFWTLIVVVCWMMIVIFGITLIVLQPMLTIIMYFSWYLAQAICVLFRVIFELHGFSCTVTTLKSLRDSVLITVGDIGEVGFKVNTSAALVGIDEPEVSCEMKPEAISSCHLCHSGAGLNYTCVNGTPQQLLLTYANCQMPIIYDQSDSVKTLTIQHDFPTIQFRCLAPIKNSREESISCMLSYVGYYSYTNSTQMQISDYDDSVFRSWNSTSLARPKYFLANLFSEMGVIRTVVVLVVGGLVIVLGLKLGLFLIRLNPKANKYLKVD